MSARRGARLRTALLTHGLTPHNEGAVYINCRGLGTCGTCAVEIVPAAGMPVRSPRLARLRPPTPPPPPQPARDLRANRDAA